MKKIDLKGTDYLDSYKIALLSIMAIAVLILSLVIVFNWSINTAQSGQIGDTIGGISSPVIALIAALLTFVAFWVQVKANKAQTAQFDKQDIDTKIDRFENKFYELIRLHKENVNEISIEGNNGIRIEKRIAFKILYNELRYTYFVTREKFNELLKSNMLKEYYSDKDILRLSYIFFYSGIENNSTNLNESIANRKYEDILFYGVLNELRKIQSYFKMKVMALNAYRRIVIEGLGEAEIPDEFISFQGHLDILGHYYRHLFQTVKFVVKQDDKLITQIQKLEYLKTLRAQLSDYEQLLLYYNAISGFGETWIENKYFTDYKMIHNIPIPFADFGVSPIIMFQKELEDGQDIFEWLN